jgi:hypothetical protein
MNAEHTDYGWLFREPDEETDGDIMIDLEHLSGAQTGRHPDLLNQIDRDTAEKTGRSHTATWV